MITLYTTGCPQCKVLEKMLNDKGITYGVVNDEQVMIDMGFTSAPMLTIDGKVYTFKEAMAWLRENNDD